jgi:hypothetical protein
VFVDDGTDALQKFALTSYPEENLRRFFEPIAGNARAGLTGLYERFKPRTIGLAIDGARGVTRGLTQATYLAFVEWFGPEASSKFTSAAPLITEYFDTRIPGEHEVYTRLVKITDEIARLALSNAVITAWQDDGRRRAPLPV